MIEDSIKDRLRGYFDEGCKELHVDSSLYKFQFEKIGKHFATVENSAELEGHVMYVNEDWVEGAFQRDEEFDLMFVMYHEARHIYQHKVIADFEERGKSSELPAVIASWKHDFENYLRNEGDADSWWKNVSQSVEIDANAFANAMLIKHEMGARIPPGQEEIMKKSIINIVKKLWNVTPQ